ncbi:MAG: hypothetical protein GY696_02190 [Gammaproteobacteria bacterium]|nr:hypothetical protein [Gammaproteobacteria bacterium]
MAVWRAALNRLSVGFLLEGCVLRFVCRAAPVAGGMGAAAVGARSLVRSPLLAAVVAGVTLLSAAKALWLLFAGMLSVAPTLAVEALEHGGW